MSGPGKKSIPNRPDKERLNKAPPIDTHKFACALTSWFNREGRRDLPWRQDSPRDPYAVWVSEIMLQQTVVAAVAPRYVQWMSKYPTIQKLAQANEQQVLREWEGLGYYARARNMHRAAGIISKSYAGEIPSDYKTLITLPGIGPYTAAAILSIAFNQPEAVIDANVKRVLQRVHAIPEVTRENEKHMKAFLAKAISKAEPQAFNEGLMELGQRVCLRSDPLCNNCPIQSLCIALKKNLQNKIPAKKTRSITHLKSVVNILLFEDLLLITKKPEGVLKDLWLLPRDETNSNHIPEYYQTTNKANIKKLGELPQRTHTYTRFAEELNPRVYRLKAKLKPKASPGFRWIRMTDLDRYPFPSTYRKILHDLERFLKDFGCN